MGFGSIWHWVIVALVVLILFGRGRISDVMGDFGKGISSFRKGMSEADQEAKAEPMRQIPAQQTPPPEPARDGPAAPVRTPEEESAARRDPGS